MKRIISTNLSTSPKAEEKLQAAIQKAKKSLEYLFADDDGKEE